MSLTSYNMNEIQLKGRNRKTKMKENNIVYKKYMCQIIIPPNLDIICFLNFFSRPNSLQKTNNHRVMETMLTNDVV